MDIFELIDDSCLESKVVEYKGIIEEGKSQDGKNLEIGWLKTLVAFANTDGGIMFIGVEDKTLKVVALDRIQTDKVVLMIHRQVKNRIQPSINYDVSTIVVKQNNNTRYVIKIVVKPNRNLPVALHDNGLLGIYIRNYGRTDLASQEQIRDLVLLSDNTPFDVPFTDEVYEFSNFTILNELLKTKGIEVTEKELISKGIVSPEKKLSKGALLFKDSCLDLRTKVVMTVWPGLTKGGDVVNASQEFIGNLLEEINVILSFVKNHSISGFKKLANTRVEYFSYPVRSILEGVVNAVGHRNYYIQGSQIEINIFKDRLEITSPGSLLGVKELYKEKNISQIIPRRRNDVICSILEMCKYMEEKGSGFDKIESDYEEYGEEFMPYVSADSNSFTLTLPDLTIEKNINVYDEDNIDVYVLAHLDGKNDLQILSYCYNNSRTIREVAENIGVTPSSYFRQNTIQRLVNQGLLLEINDGNGKKIIANKHMVYKK